MLSGAAVQLAASGPPAFSASAPDAITKPHPFVLEYPRAFTRLLAPPRARTNPDVEE